MGREQDMTYGKPENTFAYRLKTVREERHLTQSQVAAGCGINRSTIANYESGASVPKYAQLRPLANYLGVSTDYLLYGEDSYDPDLSRNTNILLQTLRGASEKEIAQAIKIVEALKGTMPDD